MIPQSVPGQWGGGRRVNGRGKRDVPEYREGSGRGVGGREERKFFSDLGLKNSPWLLLSRHADMLCKESGGEEE